MAKNGNGKLKQKINNYPTRIIVYYEDVMRSKNEVLCAAAGGLAAERSEADKPAAAHKTSFLLRITYTIFSSKLHNKLFKKFYVLRLVDWLPNAVRQTNQPQHIKLHFCSE
jgi:hypothetical protein